MTRVETDVSGAEPMLTRLDLRDAEDPASGLPRPDVVTERPVEAVRAIIDDVRARGDEALADLTQRFDGVRPASLRVPTREIEDALDAAPAEVRAALELAAGRIRAHHEAQLTDEVTHYSDGVTITSTSRAVRSAGCYVPGGRASYPSTLLMTAIPARVAGVERVVVCVPPEPATGAVAPVTLAAAAVAGVDEVYAVGGAQAIAALAYGTGTIAAVDVVCGPGNLYVAVAKQEVASQVGVAAAFAGPSEVVVVADGTVDADLVAIDLMLQAEHGPDGLAWLVTWDEAVAAAVEASLARLVSGAQRREDISATLARSGYSVLVDSPASALRVVDEVAPEHLELLCGDAGALAARVRNAGAVFCGMWSPASIGDYVAGPSHVLPTHRSARFASALGVDDFRKHVHVITATPEGVAAVGPATVAMAEAEGLDSHADSVRMRLECLGGDQAPGSGT
ncbi:MAG: histidinol dehydrogenase [Microthrixaceae bacterium]|nr:histidinol dehydrogenase [Microthrixaceae bacterium]